MKRREKAELKIQSKYGFGEKGNEEFGIPGNAEILYEIYLIAFENPKESYEMDLDEKMESSQKIKEKGTAYFKVTFHPSRRSCLRDMLNYRKHSPFAISLFVRLFNFCILSYPNRLSPKEA